MICLICLHRIVFCCIKLRRCVEMIRDDTTDTDKKKRDLKELRQNTNKQKLIYNVLQ